MICVLRVVDGPAAGMKCWLKKDQRLTIGRQSDSDFSIVSDSHMSRNHLIVEGLESCFRLRDVGSSNGTFVNDFPVSVVELCNGDRIKAGLSVFEVDLGDAALPKEPIQSSQEPEGFVPSRTLSVDTLTHDQEITMRYSLDSLLELPLPGGASPEAAQPKAASPSASKGGPATGDSDSQVGEDAGRIDVLPSKFLAGFTKSADSELWRQTAEAAMWEPVRLIDTLLAASVKTHLSLIINRSQIDASQNAALDLAVTSGESQPLTETLCLFHSPQSAGVLEFYKRCLTKDAAVCIGSPEPLTGTWLHDAIDTLSYPSMLFELLSNSPERARQLARKVQFVLFEPNTQGELCLLKSI